ncbi:protein IWS1 homolog [Halyomorpha halys]|uniref:protein IWS1 homolog n=1 Tax=Halyomorpha halys TaxID=286706 RepID=UPI0006D4CAFF|nr:transcriptional regulator ATRX [Halyomorpha halys]
MYTRRDARIHHIGILFTFFLWICQTANARTYKVKDSTEQASGEEPIPFSAEFPFFAEEHPKESEENFGFSKEFNPDFIPYSESRNVTRYVNPAETYHAVKDMPGRGRDHSSRSYKGDDGYRKEDPSYRKDYRKDSYRPKDDSYDRDEPYRRQDPYKKGGDTYRKGESYRKGDAYRKDGGYRKSDSYKKEESFRKEEPRHRSGGNRDYHKEQSGHRKHESYRRDNDRPSYRKEESSYRKQEPSYRKDDSGYSREHREDSYRKKPIQNLYDDWSPEEDKSISGEREERTDESELEEDEEGDYPEGDDEPPHSYKETEPRKSVPTSMRPGPPYYTPNFKKPGDSKAHISSNQGRHDHAPTPTPQTFYTPSTKAHEQSKHFQHRKGQPVAAKSSQFDKEWSEFRPSPPDPIQPSRARSREEYPETDYSNPATKKAIVATTPMPINRQNCVKLKKMENPPNANGKYIKNMMTCYVCVDEKTGSNYEQCSYESDSKSKPYVHTTGEEEASHTSISHRQKRDVTSNDRTKREKDYYENRKDKSSYKPSYNEKSSYSDKSTYSDEKDDVSESSDKDEDEGSTADYDSDDNCYRKKKGDMSCIVCESANKQGSYEQCSYQSDPKKNKYEHSVEKVYGSPRLPESDTKYNKKEPRYTSSDEYDSSPEIPSKTDFSSSEFEAPPPSQDKSKSKNLLQGGSFGFGLDSFDFSDIGGEFGKSDFGKSEFGKSGKSKSSFDFGDSFDFDSIPEPADNEGRFSSRHDTFNFKSDEMTDIDMSKDIGGFDKKNRSDCKKVIKNKMTCYQCAGGKGAKEEECMYVAAAEPKKKHLSFSQVQEYKFDPQNTSELDMDYSPFSFGKRKYKKYHPDLTDIKFFNKLKEKATMEASRWPRSADLNSTLAKQKKKAAKGDQEEAASSRNYKHDEDDEEEEEDDVSEEEESDEDSDISENDEYNAVPTDPPEIDYKEAEKGEFHKDTESAWDPKLGISLPRYMLHKSEHEAVFDEVLASG